MTDEKREFTRRSERIEELVHRIDECGDSGTRAIVQELLQAVIELHGVALERILKSVADLPQGGAVLKDLAKDPVVSGVLSLHDIHPVAVEERVLAALERARGYLHSHGGDVELGAIEDGVVHVTLSGACGSCASSMTTMTTIVEDAIYSVAPEVRTVIAAIAPEREQSKLVTLHTH